MAGEDKRNARGASAPKPGTDPFARVDVVERASAIPQLREVPETREEIVRRRLVRVIAAVTVLVLAAVAVVVVQRWMRAKAIDEAVGVFEDNATPATLTAVLERLADARNDGERGLRARILATAVREIDGGYRKQAEDALAVFADDDDVSPDVAVARATLALSAWRPGDAAKIASSFVPAGGIAAEMHHVRSEAALAVGNAPLAKQEAEAAHALRPSSPRHAAERALVLMQLGEFDAARKLMAPHASSELAATLVRRSYAAEGRWRDVRATPAGGHVSEVDSAWDAVLTARAGIEIDGSAGAAQGGLGSIDDGRALTGDEGFAVVYAETLALAGLGQRARAALARLPAGFSVDRPRRVEAELRVALVLKEVEKAAELASNLGPAGTSKLLLGEWYESEHKFPAARDTYEALTSDARVGREASIRLAHLELTLGRAKSALQVIEPLLEAEPTEPRIVSAAALAYGRTGDAARAQEVLKQAMAARPKDAALWIAKAKVEYGAEEWTAALGTLTQAMTLAPNDPDVFAMAGDSARKLGRLDEARKHYVRARELAPTHSAALVGMLLIALDERDVDAAKSALDLVNAAGIGTELADRARARYWALSSAGAEGEREVSELMDRSHGALRRDPVLWHARAILYYQAESYGAAARAYGMAAAYDRDDVDALILRTFAQVELRFRQPAKHSVEAAEEKEAEGGFSDRQKALVRAARARYELFADHVAMAQKRAEQAVELDPKLGEAHLVLADLLQLRNRSAVNELKKAAEAPSTPPRAWAKLALALGEGKEGCEWARRYRRAAPKGSFIAALRVFPLTCE